MKKIILRFSGGLGKQICATAVVKQVKEKFPESIIHVISSYPEVFANLSCVDKYYPMAAIPYFYEEHKDFEILEFEPYIDLDYRQGKVHIIDTWCKKLGIDMPLEKRGYIELDEQEKNTAKALLMNAKLDRPLIAIQCVGGTSYYNPQEANDPTRMKHYRDLPFDTAQEIVNKIVQKGFAVIQIGLPTERPLQNTIQLPNQQVINPRWLFAILDMCQGGIFIDSFAQHAWVALGKKDGATVLWGGTNPVNLGYAVNNNMSNKDLCENIHCNRPDTFMMDLLGNGQPWKCKKEGKCMKFKADTVVDSFMLTMQKYIKQQEPVQK